MEQESCSLRYYLAGDASLRDTVDGFSAVNVCGKVPTPLASTARWQMSRRRSERESHFKRSAAVAESADVNRKSEQKR